MGAPFPRRVDFFSVAIGRRVTADPLIFCSRLPDGSRQAPPLTTGGRFLGQTGAAFLPFGRISLSASRMGTPPRPLRPSSDADGVVERDVRGSLCILAYCRGPTVAAQSWRPRDPPPLSAATHPRAVLAASVCKAAFIWLSVVTMCDTR